MSDVQVIAKLVSAVPSAGTATVRGFSPVTVQLPGTSPSCTGCGPTARLESVIVALEPIGCAFPPSTATVNPPEGRLAPVVPVVMARLPVAAGGGSHATVRATTAVPPAVTSTVRGLAPCTWQFAAMPLRPTVCEPGAIADNVSDALAPMGRTSVPSSSSEYPSGSASAPVEVVTSMAPVVALQETRNRTVEVSPRTTCAVVDPLLDAVQLLAAPARTTVWAPLDSSSKRSMPLAPMARGAAPSTAML